MNLLLLTVLAVALIVTLAGFYLSSRNQSPDERVMYRAGTSMERRIGQTGRRTTRQIAPARRFTAYTEQPSYDSPLRSWGNLWQSGGSIGIFRKPTGDPTSWLGMILVLISVFLLGLYLLHSLLPNAGLSEVGWTGNTSASTTTNQSQSTSVQQHYQASQALVRIGQVDPAQYNSQADFNTWAYSACSTASMTEVMNAYGHHYRIADVLQIEAQIDAITPQLGLLDGSGIGATVVHFGFKTTYMHNETLNDVINVANSGAPVIVGFPPAKYDGGHLLVVTGGDANYVYLADSSLYNRHSLTHTQFMNWWGGYAAIVTPV